MFNVENASTTFMFKNNVIAYVNRIFNQFSLRNEIYSTSIEKIYAFNLIKRSMNIQNLHRRFLYAFYQRIIENKKNVNNLFHHENISKELCKTCLKENKKHCISYFYEKDYELFESNSC